MDIYSGRYIDEGGCNSCHATPDEIFVVQLDNLTFRLCKSCLIELMKLSVEAISNTCKK
jgi:hypothetical protein